MVTCQMPATARMTITTANQRQSMSTPYRSRCAPRLSPPFTAEVLASKLSGSRLRLADMVHWWRIRMVETTVRSW
jgi:hypothetical protein